MTERTNDEIAAAWAEAERQRRRALAAIAQRDRLRSHFESAVSDLQHQLAVIESSTIWRLTRPLCRLGAVIPAPMRRNGMRAARVLWWAATFQLSTRWRLWQAAQAQRAAQRAVQQARAGSASDPSPGGRLPRGPQRAPMALVIDYRWPQPDRDSGSIDVMRMVSALLDLGFRVVFSANSDYPDASADRARLARHGVRCLPAGAEIERFLCQEGGTLDLCVLTRVFGGGAYLEAVSRYCPTVPIVFNMVDLHFLRAEREAQLRGDQKGLALSKRTRMREELVASRADATIVVSDHESALLAAALPEAYIVQLPLAREINRPQAGFAARRGIGFIGGFAHAPNVDALRYFFAEIWPLVLREMPECEFEIVGAALPTELLMGVPGRLRYLGHVPDIGPWFESIRVTIAPLRFGAGAKGKIASSLAAGVPCVATAVGVEGMALTHGVNVLTADDPAAFAAHVRDACTNPALWQKLSDSAIEYATAELSIGAWTRRLRETLWTIGAIADESATDPLSARAVITDAMQQDPLHLPDHPVGGEAAGELPARTGYAPA
jgi:Glycosyl transferases group 1